MGWIAEAERIQIGDRPRAHGEHVAHDAAYAGRRTLVGLDEGGVVVAFHLEHDGVAVAEIHDAGVLPRPLDHLRALGRQLAEPHAGGFVGAVLAPHDREDAELGERGRPAQDLEQSLVLIGLQPVLGHDFGGDAGSSLGVHTTALKGWILKRGACL
jgi:hypothetical protein